MVYDRKRPKIPPPTDLRVNRYIPEHFQTTRQIPQFASPTKASRAEQTTKHRPSNQNRPMESLIHGAVFCV